MKNIVLFGGGLNANICADIIEKNGDYKIVGIIDSNAEIGIHLHGYEVIGRQENIQQLVKDYDLHGGLITVGDNYGRYRLSEFIMSEIPDFTFVSAVHPSTVIGKNVSIGRNAICKAGSIIAPNATIGQFCMVNAGAQIEHDCIIGDYAAVSAGSVMGGKVTIGRFSLITLGVVILDRINIGENVVVGSGSLVLKDIPDNVMVYGSPAKIIRSIELGTKILKSM